MNGPVTFLDGRVRLYAGDCRDILPTLEPVGAIVSDPPYGQNYVHSGRGRAVSNGPTSRAYKRNAAPIFGDDKPFDPTPLLLIAPRVLLWGAHRFSNYLPAGSWLVWDKVPNGKVRTQGDGEAAWINDDPPRALRIHRLLWDGVCVGAAARSEVTAGQQRVHPMQKPVALMEWCLAEMRLAPGTTVLDPYMGAGSTGIAAVRRGHPFVGVEIEPLYFETACRRIAAACAQADMFVGGDP